MNNCWKNVPYIICVYQSVD